MIARMQFNRENRKFVVKNHDRGFYLVGADLATNFIQDAKVYETEIAAQVDKATIPVRSDWEVEQIVVC